MKRVRQYLIRVGHRALDSGLLSHARVRTVAPTFLSGVLTWLLNTQGIDLVGWLQGHANDARIRSFGSNGFRGLTNGPHLRALFGHQ